MIKYCSLLSMIYGVFATLHIDMFVQVPGASLSAVAFLSGPTMFLIGLIWFTYAAFFEREFQRPTYMRQVLPTVVIPLPTFENRNYNGKKLETSVHEAMPS